MADPAVPRISAVVVTFRSGPVLRKCLNALCAQQEPHEIIIVDNGNEAEDLGWLKAFAAARRRPVELITGHGNIGFGNGVNLGVRHASGERILIINPDAVLVEGSLQALENALDETKSPCLVGGKLFYPSGKEQRGGRREMLTLPRALISFMMLDTFEKQVPAFRKLHREHDPEPEGPVPMPVVSGALMYTRTSDFRALGGFDKRYFLHVEDIELCRRVKQVGGEVIYTPLASALHYGSTSKVSPLFVEWHKARGLTRYFAQFSKSPFEKALAYILFPFFVALLFSRTIAIRTVLHIRAAIRTGLRKLKR